MRVFTELSAELIETTPPPRSVSLWPVDRVPGAGLFNSLQWDMSYSLNSLKGDYIGDYIGDYNRGY